MSVEDILVLEWWLGRLVLVWWWWRRNWNQADYAIRWHRGLFLVGLFGSTRNRLVARCVRVHGKDQEEASYDGIVEGTEEGCP